MENWLIAANIRDDQRKRALLLHLATEAVHEIFLTLPNTKALYNAVVAKLKAYFVPKKYPVLKRHLFRQAKQEATENISEFHVRLRQLASSCEFGDVDKEILSQVIEGTTSSILRRNALRDPDITLERLLLEGRSLENAERQAADMEKKLPVAVNKVNKVTQEKKQWPKQQKKAEPKVASGRCTCCGGKWPHEGGREKCPAWGSTCHSCNKKNHFAKMCRTPKEVRTV